MQCVTMHLHLQLVDCEFTCLANDAKFGWLVLNFNMSVYKHNPSYIIHFSEAQMK